jgi:HAD domain in Swiss Army Knife RNA repair proteins
LSLQEFARLDLNCLHFYPLGLVLPSSPKWVERSIEQFCSLPHCTAVNVAELELPRRRRIGFGRMKIIFLDIDGVLNCRRTPNPRKLPYIVDRVLLQRLQRLLELTDAKPVLTSTWRHDPAGIFSAEYWGVPFIDVVPDLPACPRGDEIRKWLAEHPQVMRFAVIDDDDDELDDLPLFQPSPSIGISDEIVRGVTDYLQGRTDATMRKSGLVRLYEKLRARFERSKN